MNICIFGDSITWGASDCEKGGWVERLKSYYMESEEKVIVYNLGVPSDKTDDLLKRFRSEAIDREANFVIFAIGINDSQYIRTKDNYFVNPDRFESNIIELIKNAREIADKVMFIGLTIVDESKTMPAPWNDERYYDNESIEKYDAIIKKSCDIEGADYVSMREIVGSEELEDGLHPNSKGHERMFNNVREAIDNEIS